MTSEVDAWGAIFRDQWAGVAAGHQIERDDGRVDKFESAASYFTTPRFDVERELLARLEGPVLDLGCGPGSYALYLQNLGLQVTASDYSPGALDVCRARGCKDVLRNDLRKFRAAPGAFRSVIVMGNTLGAHQTPATFPAFLSELRSTVGAGGHLLFSMIDPLDTTDERHLAYRRRNLDQGLPPGLIRIRVRYGDLVEDWFSLWMLTADELESQTHATGWRIIEERRDGFWRLRLLEALKK